MVGPKFLDSVFLGKDMGHVRPHFGQGLFSLWMESLRDFSLCLFEVGPQAASVDVFMEIGESIGEVFGILGNVGLVPVVGAESLRED